NTTDSELIKKVSRLMQEIDQLIDKINNSIRSNDIVNAASGYSKCIDLYNQVPEGFLMKKIVSGMKLLEIYRSLRIYTEILSLQNQLGQRQFQRQAASRMPSRADASKTAYTKQGFKKKAYEYTATAKISPKTDIPEQNETQRASLKYGKEAQTASMLLNKKRERAKRNIKKGFYNEAWKDIEEALQLEPDDVESKALRAKIKTLQ
ncbi:MAG: hypothetical protein AABX65_01490, partial [Nanoarchaeota archaeon]